MTSRILAMLLAAGLMVACELPGKGEGAKVAVKVGPDTVTEAEIERALASVAGANGEKDKLKATVLEALVTQKLLVQEAKKAGLDKKPEVALDMATAQRQVLAKAYAESLPGMKEEPSAAMVEDFYRQNPNLFASRRIYRLQEIQVEAGQDRLAAIQEQLGKSKTLNEFVEWLKAQGLRGTLASGVKSSEQLAEPVRDKLATMQVGGVVVVPAPKGLAVVFVAGIQPQGLSLEQATPAIRRILLERKQKEVLDKEVKRLRAAAKIDYAEGYAPPAHTDNKTN